MGTRKLYDDDAYIGGFDATVISCEEADGRFAVVLDATAFFPEEGGQSPDVGTLTAATDRGANDADETVIPGMEVMDTFISEAFVGEPSGKPEGGANVLDVQIKGDVITHYTDAAFEVGARVHGTINWNHRYSNMQQHSGEHIFSGLVNKLFGYNNVGFHLSDNIVTMDYDGVLTADDVRKLEFLANDAIAANLRIKTWYPEADELAALDYRSKKELLGPVRIVEVPGIDICACCAPHVRQTGEIGMFKIMTLQNYKGGVRISALCGFRALLEMNRRFDIMSGISGLLSCGDDEFIANIEKMKSSVQNLKGQLAEAGYKLLMAEAEKIAETEEDAFIYTSGADGNVMRKIVNFLMERHSGYCGVFSEDNGKTTFVVGSNNKDCRELAATYRETKGAKCGGTAAMIQGSY